MGFDISGCRAHAKQLQTIVNCLLLLELNTAIGVFGESGLKLILEVAFISEVERLLEGHDLMVDCCGVGRKESGIIDVEDEKDGSLDKKAGVHFGLVESPGEDPSLDVLVPGNLTILQSI